MMDASLMPDPHSICTLANRIFRFTGPSCGMTSSINPGVPMNMIPAVRKLSLALLLAGSAFAAPAHAQINVSINLAPPAPQHEVIPVMQPGYVWAPGYWGWSGERHVWVRGRPIAQREGYRWAPDRWD